jgi:hypothetical protein
MTWIRRRDTNRRGDDDGRNGHQRQFPAHLHGLTPLELRVKAAVRPTVAPGCTRGHATLPAMRGLWRANADLGSAAPDDPLPLEADNPLRGARSGPAPPPGLPRPDRIVLVANPDEPVLLHPDLGPQVDMGCGIWQRVQVTAVSGEGIPGAATPPDGRSSTLGRDRVPMVPLVSVRVIVTILNSAQMSLPIGTDIWAADDPVFSVFGRQRRASSGDVMWRSAPASVRARGKGPWRPGTARQRLEGLASLR